jgi:hypothetical protein
MVAYRRAPRPNEDGSADLKTVPIYLSMVVWGRSFVAFFLEFCLPSLLADGNLPAFAKRHGSKFILHTTAEDFAIIEASPVYRALIRCMTVEPRLIDFSIGNAHVTLARCHRETMHLADNNHVPAIFLSPDTIWGEGALAAVDRHLSSGKRVVFLLSMRLVKEDAEPYIRKIYNTPNRIAWEVSARELNALALRFLHPMIEEYFFEPGRGTKLLPMALMWQGPNGDVLAHSFHQHPLLVYPRKRLAEFLQTIDGDLVQHACPDPADHYVVQDSDEITVIELSKRSHHIPGLFEKGSMREVADWALRGANSVHWRLVAAPIRMHAHPIDPEEWRNVEEKAAGATKYLLDYRRNHHLKFFLQELLLRYGLTERLYRRHHAVSFFIRNWLYRRRHAVSFFVRDWIGRRGPRCAYLARQWLRTVRSSSRNWGHIIVFVLKNRPVRKLVSRLVGHVRGRKTSRPLASEVSGPSAGGE